MGGAFNRNPRQTACMPPIPNVHYSRGNRPPSLPSRSMDTSVAGHRTQGTQRGGPLRHEPVTPEVVLPAPTGPSAHLRPTQISFLRNSSLLMNLPPLALPSDMAVVRGGALCRGLTRHHSTRFGSRPCCGALSPGQSSTGARACSLFVLVHTCHLLRSA